MTIIYLFNFWPSCKIRTRDVYVNDSSTHEVGYLELDKVHYLVAFSCGKDILQKGVHDQG